MKKMSEVFEFPVNVKDLEIYGKATGLSSFEECEVHAAHAINHVDALVEALEAILDSYESQQLRDSLLDNAKAALAAYRGEV